MVLDKTTKFYQNQTKGFGEKCRIFFKGNIQSPIILPKIIELEQDYAQLGIILKYNIAVVSILIYPEIINEFDEHIFNILLSGNLFG